MVQGLGQACRSDSWTHSVVQSDEGSCYGNQSGRVCTSVVLIFGCPSDTQSDEFCWPKCREHKWSEFHV